jgi:hypothetical protein
LAATDQALYIFCEHGIYTVQGEGNNDTGFGASFTDPYLVSHVGIAEDSAAVVAPDGIYHTNEYGYLSRLVGAQVEVQYQVRDTTDGYVLKASLDVGDDHWFVHDGLIVVRSAGGQYSTLAAPASTISAVKNDSNIYLIADESIYKYSATPGEDVPSIETGWYRTAGLKDFERLYAIRLLGEYVAAHTINVRVYWDWGETSYEDYSAAISSQPDLYKFSARPSPKRCQAFKIKIWPSGHSSEVVRLNGIEVEFGLSQRRNNGGRDMT